MRIGIPKEIKNREARVGMTPAGVDALTREGHTLYVQSHAGEGSGFSDEAYRDAGAEILSDAPTLYERAELIVKVKEPIPEEYSLLRESHTLFTYLHLAPNRPLTKRLLEARITAIAYESVTAGARLPLLEPMSEIAGKMAPLLGAYHLGAPHGGSGVLAGGAAGVPPGRILILGGGVAGTHAATIAAGLGADVTIMDISPARLQTLDAQMPANVRTLYSTPYHLREQLTHTDLLIGAVYVPNARTPHLVTRDMLAHLRPGSVAVDIAIDQGGCLETSRPTTHDDPVYVEEGVVHYCVANMPGAYPRTSTLALTNATLPYVRELANRGFARAVEANPGLRDGINAFAGTLTQKNVADAHGMEYTPYPGSAPR